jgi:hypothetical protein
MAKELKIWLPGGWAKDSSKTPSGPPTIRWDNPKATGTVQLSATEYTGGPEPRPSEGDLTRLALGFGQQHRWGELVGTSSGKCVLGRYGTASFKRSALMPPDAAAYCQVWFLSNGLDIVFVTFIAKQKPELREMADAQKIAINLDFG